MNTRSVEILKKLCGEKNYQVEDLAHDFEISIRMIRYVIDDINDFLETINIKKNIMIRNGKIQFNITHQEKEILMKEISNLDNYVYAISPFERKCYILVSMWCCSEPLTSQYFADEMNVSKSSIDKDILSIRQEYEGYDFSINVKTGKGSYIEGDERDIRSCFFRVIEKNIDFNKFMHFQYTPITFIEKNIYRMVFDKYWKIIIKVMNDFESHSEKKLTYLSYKDICIHLAVSLTRIELGYDIILHQDYLIEISKTEGYHDAQFICSQIMQALNIKMSQSEVAIITILLNSARYTTLKRYVIYDWANIQMIATTLAFKVGEKLNVNFSRDEELINSLTLHLGPTVFKLQNQVPVVNPSLTVIKKNYHEVFIALLETIDELCYKELKGIKEDDIAFLTLHFCAALERKNRFKDVYNVVIVCVHGFGTASLMKEMICSRFKNIIVKKTVTEERILNIDLSNIDFIISSIDLQIMQCLVVKVNVILKESDYRLIENAMEKIVHQNIQESDTFMDGILSIVKRNCEIVNYQQLFDDFSEYFKDLGIDAGIKLQPLLNEYLTADKVLLCDTVDHWETAVCCAGQMLVKSQDIAECYIKSMIDTVKKSGSYMVIDEGIALIHGEIDYGVNQTSMSLLIIKNGVKFNHDKYDPVHIILCLAAKDNYTHMKALNNFIKFLENIRNNGIERYFELDYVLDQINEVSKYD